MPKFSKKSEIKLLDAHHDLQLIFNTVIKYFDCTIICTYRNKEDQNRAYKEGKSSVQFPNSKHNRIPSLAVDAAPYPIDFNDTKRIIYFAGYVKAVASILKSSGQITHSLRWGGDWDNDTEVTDNIFNDYLHYEIYY